MKDLQELLALYRAERGGSIGETEAGVRTLSAMFNGLTPRRPGYLAAAPLRRAYVHYYLPVNSEKVSRVLAELATYAALPGRPRVLDFGCGPGTAAIAALRRTPVADLALVDTVDEALDDAAFFCRALGVEARRLREPPAGERFDLVLAANVLSETPAALENLVADDGYLVVVEPALRESTRRLMEARDRWTAAGFRVAAPCLRDSRCPMLEHDVLWCHEDAAWPRPAAVAEIDRRAGLTKETLKYSYLVLTRKGRTLADRGADARVVSNLHREKGKAWAWLCGRSGALCRTEVLTRHRGPSTAAFFHASRGGLLRMRIDGAACRSEGPVEDA